MPTVREFPPKVPPTFGDMPLDGGRVRAITVDPTWFRNIFVVTQFGGLWNSEDGGASWFHIDGLPAVFISDVAFADGSTVVPTLGRDNQLSNGGGIWVSPNGGGVWSMPSTGRPPPSSRVPSRISAYGI